MRKIDLAYIKNLGKREYDIFVPDKEYEVIKSFYDESRTKYEKGQKFKYLTYTYLPYHDGLQLWVEFINHPEYQFSDIRFHTSIVEEYAEIVRNWDKYFKEI